MLCKEMTAVAKWTAGSTLAAGVLLGVLANWQHNESEMHTAGSVIAVDAGNASQRAELQDAANRNREIRDGLLRGAVLELAVGSVAVELLLSRRRPDDVLAVDSQPTPTAEHAPDFAHQL